MSCLQRVPISKLGISRKSDMRTNTLSEPSSGRNHAKFLAWFKYFTVAKYGSAGGLSSLLSVIAFTASAFQDRQPAVIGACRAAVCPRDCRTMHLESR